MSTGILASNSRLSVHSLASPALIYLISLGPRYDCTGRKTLRVFLYTCTNFVPRSIVRRLVFHPMLLLRPSTKDQFSLDCGRFGLAYTFGPLRLISNHRRGVSPYSSAVRDGGEMIADNPAKPAFRRRNWTVPRMHRDWEKVVLLNIDEVYTIGERSQASGF